MPNKKTLKIHGVDVQQIELQGKYYTPVAARVKIAQNCAPDAVRASGGGFHVVSHSILPVGERWAFTCVVEYPVGSGVHTSGSDFIDVKDATGLAKAETSAIGRALSFHGIDIEGGIASAEEMERVVPTEQERNPGSTLERVQEFQQIVESTIPTVVHIPVEPTKADWDRLRVRVFKDRMIVNPPQWEGLMQETGGDYEEALAKVEAWEQNHPKPVSSPKSAKVVKSGT